MKVTVVFAAIITLCSSNAIPKILNSDYIESVTRYVWMSNDHDELIQVDLQEEVTTDAAGLNRGVNNEYWLFTRHNPTNPQLLVDGDIHSITASNYRADKSTNIITHGWNGSGRSNVNIMVRDAFLAAYDCNVIVVDWNGIANSNYLVAVNGVPRVGQFLGNFLNWLVTSTGGDWEKLHLSGYSLGAHVVGVAGRSVGGKPARITGLDPAGPLWHLNSNRLSSNSGQYVEAIHTDGGRQGIFRPVGDVDFYPNGGRNQPGCDDSACSHARSYRIFASSIRTNHFVGRRCSNIVEAENLRCFGPAFNMGNGFVGKRGHGLFGLRTESSWPY